MPEITKQLIKPFVEVSKTDVGLSNVDNTSDLAKPISIATQIALNNVGARLDVLEGGTPVPVDTTAPTITSASTATVAENVGFTFALTANEPVTWSKVGGADMALFTLTGSTLTMGAKDYETPTDNGANNTYIVQVRATDATGNFSLQTITVTVTDVSEGGGTPPTITSSGTITVSDTDPYSLSLTANESVTWSIAGGVDAALFDLDTSTTGAIGFNPDLPTDNGANNIYELTVRATSVATGLTSDQNITITVTPPAPTGNLFLLPDELNDTTVWKRGNSNFTPNSAVALSGLTTAELMYPNATTNFVLIYQTVNVVNGTTYEMSFEVKPSGKTKLALGGGAGFAYVDVWYDLTAQTAGTGSGVTATITALSNGWFRVKYRKASAATGASNMSLYLCDTTGAYNCAVNGSDGLLVANAQMVAV